MCTGKNIFRKAEFVLFVLYFTFYISSDCHAQALTRHEFSAWKMGTQFRIVLYWDDTAEAEIAATAAFHRIDELNQIFSVFIEDSEISHLSSKSGSQEWIPVSQDMWNVLQASQKFSLASHGAFDISIGPLSKLWRQAIRQQEMPSDVQIAEAKSATGYQWIEMDSASKTVRLMKSGMILDSGGIAKGYAVDQAFTIIEQYGIQTALVDGGGDIYMGKAPPGKDGWDLKWGDHDGIPGSWKEKGVILENIAIAGSGDTYRYLQWDGKRYSHIVDPRTGMGVSHQAFVSIAAPDCMTADALASALSVLGPCDVNEILDQFEKTLSYVKLYEN